MTGCPVNANNNPETVAIDIPDVAECCNSPAVHGPVQTIQIERQNEDRVINSINLSNQRAVQHLDGRNVPYIDRILGANFGFPRIYSIFPLMNGFPGGHQQDNRIGTRPTDLRETIPGETVPGVNVGVPLSGNVYPVTTGVLNVGVTNVEEIQPPAVDFNAPPPYDAPSKLPTYEEVQREKALQGEIPMIPPGCIPQETNNGQSPHALAFLAIDAGDIGPNSESETKLLGTDFMFLMAFMIALFFNWIGFLLLMCFCHTVAARYGALSGFGLSLAKWTVIVKGATDMPIQNGWLWWLITAFGLLICVRSFFQYINIKKGWRLMSAATQERLLFFY